MKGINVAKAMRDQKEKDTRTQEKIRQQVAELSKKYWVIYEGELYTKQGKDAKACNRYYAHRDPAGVIYWNYDDRMVSNKEFQKILSMNLSWRDTVVPVAYNFYQED
jgi:hypothetical protein